MSAQTCPTARIAPGSELTLRLHLIGQGERRRWTGEVVDSAEPPLHFASLPELIGWLARLQWQTCGAPGVK